MALTLADRVKETTTTEGTGALALGGAVNGFLSFASRLAVGDITFYAVVQGTQWEVGLGTLTAATTLARTAVLASSNSDALVPFASGTKEVFVDFPAALASRLADFAISEATVASAATVDLGAQNSRKIAITGSAAITSFGTFKHAEKLLRFTGACTLTHDATALILPTGANIVTAAGDTALATSDGSGNWRVRHYQRADGTSLRAPLSFRNRIRNGNFAINQRATASASATYAAGAYILDGWKAGANGATLSFAASANGDVTVTITAGTLLQIIEGGVYIPEGGSYTLGWQGTATARVYQGSATGSYAASPLALVSLSAGANTTVEFSTGTLSLTQFEPGAIATPFERRDDEIRRNQRYYQIGQNYIFGSGYTSASYISAAIRLSTPMRANPTVTIAQVASSNMNAPSISVNGPQDILFYGNTTVATTLAYYQFNYYASAEL